MSKPILVHSCTIKKDGCPRDLVISGNAYVGELGVSLDNQGWYYPLPSSCRCKRRVSAADATEWVGRGWAVWILQFKRRKGEVVLNDEVSTKIWMPVERSRVQRVDLISRSDVERAYIGSEKKSKHYKYNRDLKRYVSIRTIPEGMNVKQWHDDEKQEVKFEKRIRSQYSDYIEEVHELYMGFRAKLIVPFIPDPFEGRCLFSFNSDQRTVGGYAEIKDLDTEI